jgi:hypothetical protein
VHDVTVSEHLRGDTRIPVLDDAALQDVVGTGHPDDATDAAERLRVRPCRGSA